MGHFQVDPPRRSQTQTTGGSRIDFEFQIDATGSGINVERITQDGYPTYEAYAYDCYCAGGEAKPKYEFDQGTIYNLAGNGHLE